MQDTLFQKKWQDLLEVLKNKGKLAIACSGGLDSRLLAYAVHKAKIPYKILHVEGLHIPKEEENILQDFAQKLDLQINSIGINPLEIGNIKENPIDRCYYCKKEIFSLLKVLADDYLLCDGSNTDDLQVYRPGNKAIKELEIFSPYLEANISKEDIRNIAEYVALPYKKQRAQACLLTRFNYNIPLEAHSILWLDYAENCLKSLISSPFRIRAISQNVYELHIESAKDAYASNIKNIEAKLKLLAKENLKINTEIAILFFDSLRSYFDKKIDIS